MSCPCKNCILLVSCNTKVKSNKYVGKYNLLEGLLALVDDCHLIYNYFLKGNTFGEIYKVFDRIGEQSDG